MDQLRFLTATAPFLGWLATAAPSPAAQPPAPAAHLAADRAAIDSCLSSAADSSAETRCLDVVQTRCVKGVSIEESSTTPFSRVCAQRAFGAWEAIVADSARALEKQMEPNERKAFAAAQQAWQQFVTANVRAHAERYAGGTLEMVLAGTVRARMAAERALEIRRMIRERRE